MTFPRGQDWINKDHLHLDIYVSTNTVITVSTLAAWVGRWEKRTGLSDTELSMTQT